MLKTIMLLMILTSAYSLCLAQDKDILDIAEKNPRLTQVQNPDGTWRTPKYGDYKLEKATENLKDYSRPWTVKKVLKWYRKAKNDKVRANLLRVLAASKSSRAAVVLGNALEDTSLEVRISALDGLMDYFIGWSVSGGPEQHFVVTKEWWEKNKERLEAEANKEND